MSLPFLKKSAVLILFGTLSLYAKNSPNIFGTPQEILQKIVVRQQFLVANPTPNRTSTYSFPMDNGVVSEINIHDYYYEGGELSMTGEALETQSQNSVFIFKGNASSLYGWLVLKDKNLAWEYTTDPSGLVVVTKVPVNKIFPVCNFHGPMIPLASEKPNQNVPEAGIDSINPHIGDYDGTTDVTKLQSLKGATKVFYINITSIMSHPKSDIWQMWQSQAAGYSPWQVNVTTDPAVYQAAGTANSGASKMNTGSGRSSCGINSWGTGSACSLNFDGAGNGYSSGRTIVHESGHQIGLNHDGTTSGVEYFGGFSTYSWGPIMGDFWPGDRWANEAIYQWSKGEYSGANNKEDDLTIISGKLTRKPDDFPGTSPLKMVGTKVPGLMNRGRIGKDDEDVFSFKITGSGNANLNITRIEYMGGGMLDVDASILDATGKVIIHDNKVKIRGATLVTPLTAGDYTLVIKGGAEGTPGNGFSNYASAGFYAIDGEITGAVPIESVKTKLDRSISAIMNPSLTRLELFIPSDIQINKISLLTLSGKTVFSSNVKVSSIPLTDLSRGSFFLKIETKGEIIQRKITVF